MRRLMSPVRGAVGLAALLAAACALAGCGVAADDTAATVLDRTVSVNTVDELARDAAFVTSVFQGTPAPETESVLPGELARDTLTFLVQSEAAEAELARLGGEVGEAELAAAEQIVRQQVSGDPSEDTVEVLTRYVATNQALAARLGELDPTSEEDRRLVYDGAPALWGRTCLLIVAVPAEQADELSSAVEDGDGLREAADALGQDAQVLADPDESCISTAQLPRALRDGIEAEADGAGGPVTITTPTGDQSFFWQVEGTQFVQFEEAGDELDQIISALAEQPEQTLGQWLGVTMLGAVEVNPRYGQPSVSLQGAFEIVPPAQPLNVTAEVPVPSLTP